MKAENKKTKAAPLVDMEADAAAMADAAVTNTSLAGLMELINRQLAIEEMIANLSASLKLETETLRALTEQEIPTFFDQVGVKEIKLPDGTVVTVEEKVYPNIAADDWAAAAAWFKDHDLDSLIKNEVKVTFGKGEDEKASQVMELLVEEGCTNFTSKQFVHPQTLGAFVRERLESGEELPSVIHINPIRKSTIKKPKARK